MNSPRVIARSEFLRLQQEANLQHYLIPIGVVFEYRGESVIYLPWAEKPDKWTKLVERMHAV